MDGPREVPQTPNFPLSQGDDKEVRTEVHKKPSQGKSNANFCDNQQKNFLARIQSLNQTENNSSAVSISGSGELPVLESQISSGSHKPPELTEQKSERKGILAPGNNGSFKIGGSNMKKKQVRLITNKDTSCTTEASEAKP